MLPTFFASIFCRLLVIPRVDGSINLSPFPSGTCTLCCTIEPNNDVEYQLYTRKNPNQPEILKYQNKTSLKISNFNTKHPSVIYIHGYAEQSTGKSASTLKNAYLERGEYNVILVDWGKLSAMPWYITAVKNTKKVGIHVAKMISWLDKNNAVSMSRIHVIGFSLGAEVAGFIGKSLSPKKIGRITGLDAAYPLYMHAGMDGHLTSSDAIFVDVIHTDGGILGFPSPIGHADFYPNNGRPLQPGCTPSNLLTRGMFTLFQNYIVCSHNRAWKFYAESVINPHGFVATKCKMWRPNVRSCTWMPNALMGYATNSNTRGIFYLKTNSNTPFARNLTDFDGRIF